MALMALKQFGWVLITRNIEVARIKSGFRKVYDKMNYFIVNSLKMEAILEETIIVPENAQFCHFGSRVLFILKN